MSVLDFSHLSTEQRLELIDELWGSVDVDQLPLTPAQAVEIDRRMASLDSEVAHAREASVVFADLRTRYR